jgi:hypothetical protein
MQDNNITRVIRAALRFQDSIASKLTDKKRKAGEGRTGKLVVDDPTGKDHTVLYFKVESGRLYLLEEEPAKIRNEIIFYGDPQIGYTGVDLFLDVIKEPRRARSAYAGKMLIITGDLAEYDSEEIMQICEDMLRKIAQNVNV